MDIVTGPVAAIDLGRRCGYAKGAPGARPFSCSVDLRQRPAINRFGNFIEFLQRDWTGSGDGDWEGKGIMPELVGAATPMPMSAMRPIKGDDGEDKFRNSEATNLMRYGLYAILLGMCDRYGIRFEETNDSTVRKHFCGIGRAGSRDETKKMVIARCHLLDLMPRDRFDDNRADALAMHDWLCAMHGRRSTATQQLFMTGEQPR